MLIARFHAALSAGVPTAIHLLPPGRFTAADGRTFDNADPASVVAASMASGRQLAIDENHATDLAAKAGFSARACGRITGMDVRADGIWGAVEWNEDGQAMLAAKAYDSISAVIEYAEGGAVRRILRASLTNDPAVPELTRLFHTSETRMELTALRAALGLPDTADEAACLEAARTAHQARASAQTHLATFAAAAGVAATATADQIVAAIRGGSTEMTALMARTVALETELGQLRTATLQAEAVATVDAAIKDGAPVLALRDHLIAQFQKDAAGVKLLLAGLPRLNVGGGIKPAAPDPKNPVATLAAVDLEVAKQMGIDPAALAKAKAARLVAEEARAA